MVLRLLMTPRSLLVIGIALVMAFISAKFLFDGSALNTIPWGILAIAIGFFAASQRESFIFGATFGFVVSYAFLWFDNSGSKTLSKVLILIPLVVVPALFGALCGLTLAWLGWKLRSALRK